MLYTSGTTGHPKGVVLSHDNLIAASRAYAELEGLRDDEEVLAYLPMAWIGQNLFSYAQWMVVGFRINCPESAETVITDMREIGPTYYFAPPRVLEALLTQVTIRMEDASRVKRWHVPPLHGRSRGASARRSSTAGRWALVDRLLYALGGLLIYAPLRNALGHVARARGLHRGRGHRPRPLRLLPLARHQPEAALRLDGDLGHGVRAAQRRR